MKTNPVKAKLCRGEPTFGTWLSLDNLHAARVLARMGFDWLTLDLEHSAIDWREASALIGAIAEGGCVPLVRVPEGSHHYIKRALDAGAWGVVVPMVQSLEQARAAVAAAKYPPEGTRSAGGGQHALGFEADAAEYYERANAELLVVLQIESPRGVDNAEAILGQSGCDAAFIGPVDLAFTLRTTLGRPPTPEEHEAQVQRVVAAGRRVGVPTGIHVMTPDEALDRAKQGMQFMAIGSELRMIADKAGEILDRLHPDRPRRPAAGY